MTIDTDIRAALFAKGFIAPAATERDRILWAASRRAAIEECAKALWGNVTSDGGVAEMDAFDAALKRLETP